MLTEPQPTRISKTLSFHLRHRPDALGMTLGPGGWVAVDDLLAALARHGKPVTRAELDDVVAWNPKQRFAFDEPGTRIRASQGHSVAVDLELGRTSRPPCSTTAPARVRWRALCARGCASSSATTSTSLPTWRRPRPPAFLQVETRSATAQLSVFDARADSDAALQRSAGGPSEYRSGAPHND